MGSSESKLKSKTVKDDHLSDVSTPKQTQKLKIIKNLSEFDPRSPSDNIVRTPIEVSNKTSLLVEGNRIPNLISIVDPRSPTDQFIRTPIVTEGKISAEPTVKLHNKILDNARGNLLCTPTMLSKNQKDFVRNELAQTTPKMLQSNLSFKDNIGRRKSLVGLLETNIDYRETDLDCFVKKNSLDSSLTININESSISENDEIKTDNCDPRSPSSDFLRTPIQITSSIRNIEPSTSSSFISEETSNSLGNCRNETLLKMAICETHTDQMKDEDISTNNKFDEVCVFNGKLELSAGEIKCDKACEDVVDQDDHSEDVLTSSQNHSDQEKITHSIDDLLFETEALELTESEKEIENEELELKEPVIDLTAHVQEFDRKLTKIIHETEDTILFKKAIILGENENPRNRTPMKDRNTITEPKRNKLRVSDKPRKLEYSVSKIPMFKDNSSKLKIQCENTPPRNVENRKKKKNHQATWDSDRTLVI